MSPQCCARLCITSAEKYNPSDSPMTQRPNLLNGAGHRVGMPATRVAAVRNSGPSSQGNGVPIQTARPAPTRAMQRPRMTGAMRVSMAKDDTRTQPPTYGSALPFLFPNGTGFAVHTGMWLELSCFS